MSLYVTPARGLTVRDPATGQALADEPTRVPNTSYWRRRLACGDAVVAKRPKRPRKSNATTDEES